MKEVKECHLVFYLAAVIQILTSYPAQFAVESKENSVAYDTDQYQYGLED